MRTQYPNRIKGPAEAISRRALFLGACDYRLPYRPPWSLAEAIFVDLCDGCGDCVAACPARVLKLGPGLLAEIDFNLGACDFCGDCRQACRRGALDRKDGWALPLQAHIQDRCLSKQGTVCRVCEESCEDEAISFQLLSGGRSRPLVALDKCSGCGGCAAMCPIKAVDMQPRPPDRSLHRGKRL